MNKDDIIKMAKEYADEVTNGYGVTYYEFDLYGLEKFALLIRAAEREACAKVQPDLSQVGEVGVWGERQWQGLTDEELRSLWDDHVVPMFGRKHMNPIVYGRALEVKLKERNT